MTTVESFYRSLAVHRRVRFYQRFRRGRMGGWLPSLSRTLRRMDSYVDELSIAQGLSVGKLLGQRRTVEQPMPGLSFPLQFGIASVLVMGIWFYWPAHASAPVMATHATAQVLAAAVQPASAPQSEIGATIALAAIPVLEEASTAAVPQATETRLDLKALIAQVTANSENDDLAVLSSPVYSLLSIQGLSPLFVELAERRGPTTTAEESASSSEDVESSLPSPARFAMKVSEGVANVLFHATHPRPESQDDGLLEIAPPSTQMETVVVIQPQTQPPAPVNSRPTPAPNSVQPATPFSSALAVGVPWETFVPAIPAEADHYWLDYPFTAAYNRFYSPSYQFGSTAGGRYRPHHGVDIANPAGTPVIAMAVGEVIHAGPDNPTLLGPYNNFYGNSVVILLDRKLETPQGAKDVYLLYGHLSEVNTQRGERVAVGDRVGTVGMTGIAIGPHLHIEVRVGHNSYTTSVNSVLWMRPLPGTGSVAVRLLNSEGRSWVGAKLSLLRFDANGTRWVQTLETYRDEERLSGDPSWGENGALSNLPAGNYYITGEINGEKVGQNLTINAGETTFVELRTTQ